MSAKYFLLIFTILIVSELPGQGLIQIHTSQNTYYAGDSTIMKVYFQTKDIGEIVLEAFLVEAGTEHVSENFFLSLNNSASEISFLLDKKLKSNYYFFYVANPVNGQVLGSKRLIVIGDEDNDQLSRGISKDKSNTSDFQINERSAQRELIVESRINGALNTIDFQVQHHEALENISVSIVDLSYELNDANTNTGPNDQPFVKIDPASFNSYMLAGRQLFDNSDQPIADKRVALLFGADVSPVRYTTTGSDGNFHLNYNYLCGSNTALVGILNDQAVIDVSSSTEIRIARSSRVSFPQNEATFSFSEDRIVSLSARKKKVVAIQKMFGLNTFTAGEDPGELLIRKDKPAIKFYSDHDQAYHFDDYVYFPTMRETLKRLFQEVKILKKGLRLFSKELNYTYDEAPLILVDDLPVYDLDALLESDPSMFDSLIVLNSRNTTRLLGNVAKYGVLALTTKERNFDAGYTPAYAEFKGMDCSHRRLVSYGNIPENAPRLWHLVYWNGAVEQGLNYQVKMNDNATSYLIRVFGQKSNGEIVSTYSILKGI